jgi:flagellar basal body-associated protein FliL
VKLGKKTIALLGVPLGLGVAAGLVYFFVLAGPSVKAEIPDPGEGQHGPMIALEERVVNLLKGGDYRYAKVGVTVELRPESADFYALKGEARTVAEEEIHKDYQAAVPLMLDAVGRTVGARSSTELGTPEGREGLKAELLHAMGEILGEHDVLSVYFTDLVMQ